jgi:hypothetical protein
MITNLNARLELLKTDIKKLLKEAETDKVAGTFDEWKQILKTARHLESLAISRMSVIKYRQALSKKGNQ